VGDVDDGVSMTAVGDIVGTVTPDTVGVTDEVLKRRNDCDCTPFTLLIPYIRARQRE